MMPAPLPRKEAKTEHAHAVAPGEGIKLRDAVVTVAILGSIALGLQIVFPEPYVPSAMKGVRDQPDSRIIFENIRLRLEGHYDLFKFFHEHGVLGFSSTDENFARVYRMLAQTEETADEEALHSIMSAAMGYMHIKPDALRDVPRHERAFRILRGFARKHFLDEVRAQCPDCTEAATRSIAYEQADVVFSSCFPSVHSIRHQP